MNARNIFYNIARYTFPLHKQFTFTYLLVMPVTCLHAYDLSIKSSWFDVLPKDAIKHGSFYLCSSDHTGIKKQYSCHNFKSRYGFYRVLFNSGTQPKAIFKVDTRGKVIYNLWTKYKTETISSFIFKPPSLIPASSYFVGAGVCIDENDNETACAAFREKMPRTKSFIDYLVYYKQDRTGPYATTSIKLESYIESFSAELAFQLGLSLHKEKCCTHSAKLYLDYSYQLFPGSNLYQGIFEIETSSID